jgi:hypothetical protein
MMCSAQTNKKNSGLRSVQKAAAIASGPHELEPLANWVRGTGSDEEVGILVQQLLGQLFSSRFVATEESWEAAKILVAAPRSKNVPKMAWWFVSGKVRRAKRFLADMVEDDLSAVNAIGIATHNVVKSFRRMRVLYADTAIRFGLSPETAAEQCLFAPVSLYRQATVAGQMGALFAKFIVRAWDRRGESTLRRPIFSLYGRQLESMSGECLGSRDAARGLETRLHCDLESIVRS